MHTLPKTYQHAKYNHTWAHIKGNLAWTRFCDSMAEVQKDERPGWSDRTGLHYKVSAEIFVKHKSRQIFCKFKDHKVTECNCFQGRRDN